MKFLLCLPFVALFLTSCSTLSTPASRIEKNPHLYDKLPSSHQALVDKGRIKNGMSKDAVYLAWGRPDRTSEGEDHGKHFERWVYTTLRPIYSHRFGISYGSGRRYGYYPYYGRSRYGYNFGHDVHYIKQRAATVDFRGDRVTRWQRGRN